MIKPTAANVLRIFREGTEQDVSTGRAWYGTARQAATDLDPADPARGAAVIAVLSPMMPWGRNLTLARQAYDMAAQGATYDEIRTGPGKGGNGLGCLPGNAAKAAAIVLGADPAQVVTGPKVIPFWQRIMDAANGATGPGSVVIDRHAFDIAVGQVTDDDTRSAGLRTAKGRYAVAMAYVRAAAVLRRTGEAPDITPSELQAVVWVVWRREHAHYMGKAEARREAAQAA